MLCAQCHQQNPEKSRFCQYCKEPLLEGAYTSMQRIIQEQKNHAVKPRAVLERPIPFKRLWKISGLILGVLVLLTGLFVAGAHFAHAKVPRMPTYNKAIASQPYLISFTTEMTLTAERDGRLDTTIENRKREDIGRLELQPVNDSSSQNALSLSALEWVTTNRSLQNTFAGEDMDAVAIVNPSTALPLNDPLLRPLSMALDDRGALMRYREGGPFIQEAAHFIAPMFPRPGHFHPQQWIEPIAWQTQFGAWTVFWDGELLWRLDKEIPCGDHACTRLTFEGLLRPQLRTWPSWGPKNFPAQTHQGVLSGEALFDPKRGILIENTVEWQSHWRGRLDNVGRIPMEIRVGRRVEGEGDLVMECKGRMTVRNQQ